MFGQLTLGARSESYLTPPPRISMLIATHQGQQFMFSQNYGFLFIHVPKTAGNAVQHSLLPYSNDELVLSEAHHDGEHRFEIRSPGLGVHKHSTMTDYLGALGASTLNSLFLLVTVRNPWDRCVSHFFSPHRGPIVWSPEDFGRYISKHVLPLQHYLALPDDRGHQDAFDRLDGVIRFEQLDEDFSATTSKLGLPPLELQQRNPGQHRPYQEYYTDEDMIDLVANRFAAEIRQFGYRFE